jgi:hypothetical protein
MQDWIHRGGRWALVMALGLLAMGCGGGGGGITMGPAPATARGLVVDLESRAPLAGASVRSAGRSARTAADGSFVLGIETGIASITVSRSNYHTQTFTAEAVVGQEVDMGTLTLANTDGAPPPPPFESDP